MLPVLLLVLATDVTPPVTAPVLDAPRRVAGLLPARGPRLRLTRGRGELVDEAGLTSYRAPLERSRLPASGHLELGALGDADLAWAGRGSLHLEGPGALAWGEAPFEPGGVLRLLDFQAADLEVRSGRLGLELPGAVHVELGRGALQVLAGSAGRYSLHHLGGEPVPVRHPGPGAAVTLVLDPGDRLDLDPEALLGHLPPTEPVEPERSVEPELVPEPAIDPEPAVEPMPVVVPEPTNEPEPVIEAEPTIGPEPTIEAEPLRQPADLDPPVPSAVAVLAAPASTPALSWTAAPLAQVSGPAETHLAALAVTPPGGWLPVPLAGQPLAPVAPPAQSGPGEPVRPTAIAVHAPVPGARLSSGEDLATSSEGPTPVDVRVTHPASGSARPWAVSELPGEPSRVRRVHLLLRTATGPAGPVPMAVPFDPVLGSGSSGPVQGFRPRPDRVMPAPPADGFNLSDLLNGRVEG